jgi:large subunit ribosomal protein L25
MAHLQLAADARTETGGGPSRRLRREGQVPGVVYQSGGPSIAFTLSDRELRRALLGDGGRTSVIDLRIGGAPARPVIFKEWQVNPVRGDILHVDFQEVDLTETFEAHVAIVLEGTPAGVREGGVLDHSLREVTVRALPDSLPDQIVHDVSDMNVGDAITVADLVAPAGSEIVTDPDQAVASVLYPTLEPEPEEAELAEDEDLQPEVVGEDVESDESE